MPKSVPYADIKDAVDARVAGSTAIRVGRGDGQGHQADERTALPGRSAQLPSEGDSLPLMTVTPQPDVSWPRPK